MRRAPSCTRDCRPVSARRCCRSSTRMAACWRRMSPRPSTSPRSTMRRSTATRCGSPICGRAAEPRCRSSGAIAAGAAPAEAPAAGTALRIFTGAPMPPGFDTVFMQEDVRSEAGQVLLPSGLNRGANRRLAGEDISRGERAHDRRNGPDAAPYRPSRRARPVAGRRAPAPPRRRVLDRRRDRLPGRPSRRRQDLRREPLHAAGAPRTARLHGDGSRHPARRPRHRRAARCRTPPPVTISSSPPGACRRARRTTSRLPSRAPAAFLLASRHQAGAAGGHGRRQRHAFHRPARQSGRRVRHLRACGAAR